MKLVLSFLSMQYPQRLSLPVLSLPLQPWATQLPPDSEPSRTRSLASHHSKQRVRPCRARLVSFFQLLTTIGVTKCLRDSFETKLVWNSPSTPLQLHSLSRVS